MEMSRNSSEKTAKRRRGFKILTILIVWLVCELIIAVGMPSKEKAINSMDPEAYIAPHRHKLQQLIDGKTNFMIFSRELGWTHKAWGHHGIDRANGQGIRADRDFAIKPPPSTLRIATFGGSFVYGADVSREQTWQALMEQTHHGVEVLNFGVSGYGTDQALLRYRLEGEAFSPDIVVLGFISENQRRNLTTFRPFYLPATGLPLGKPRFRVKKDRLILVPNPFRSLDDYRALLENPERELPRIGADDSYYSQYEGSSIPFIDRLPSATALRFWWKRASNEFIRWREAREPQSVWAERISRNSLLLKLFDAFTDEARTHGSTPIIMLCPIDLEYRGGDGIHADPYPLIKRYLKARGEDYVDLAEVFAPYLQGGGRVPDLFANGERGGHYSAVAHRLIQKAMWKKFRHALPKTRLPSTSRNELADRGPKNQFGFVQ